MKWFYGSVVVMKKSEVYILGTKHSGIVSRTVGLRPLVLFKGFHFHFQIYSNLTRTSSSRITKRPNESMNEWINDWMNEWMNEWAESFFRGLYDVFRAFLLFDMWRVTYGRTDGQTNPFIETNLKIRLIPYFAYLFNAMCFQTKNGTWERSAIIIMKTGTHCEGMKDIRSMVWWQQIIIIFDVSTHLFLY